MDLARLQVGEVDAMFEKIKNTSAVIFDMRGYPKGTAWRIAPRLTERENVSAAIFSTPIRLATIFGIDSPEQASFTLMQQLLKRQGDVYQGKVVMLINEAAVSQAEHTCLVFEAATDVTFVGTPTSGVDGDVTNTILPGNLVVSFSGHGVRHADGRQLQRIGIQPDIKAEQTIQGFLVGRDEILEAAIKFLGGK
ncbi:hypothetical protein BH20ACI1_BH20ACI1_09590 [soil metagenome]